MSIPGHGGPGAKPKAKPFTQRRQFRVQDVNFVCKTVIPCEPSCTGTHPTWTPIVFMTFPWPEVPAAPFPHLCSSCCPSCVSLPLPTCLLPFRPSPTATLRTGAGSPLRSMVVTMRYLVHQAQAELKALAAQATSEHGSDAATQTSARTDERMSAASSMQAPGRVEAHTALTPGLQAALKAAVHTEAHADTQAAVVHADEHTPVTPAPEAAAHTDERAAKQASVDSAAASAAQPPGHTSHQARVALAHTSVGTGAASVATARPSQPVQRIGGSTRRTAAQASPKAPPLVAKKQLARAAHVAMQSSQASPKTSPLVAKKQPAGNVHVGVQASPKASPFVARQQPSGHAHTYAGVQATQASPKASVAVARQQKVCVCV